MKTMQVVAMKGTRCPMEGQKKKYITDAKAVEVPASAYYLRRLRDGSIAAAPAGAAPSEQPSVSSEQEKQGAKAAGPVGDPAFVANKPADAASGEKKPV
jgi:hypothetical protein